MVRKKWKRKSGWITPKSTLKINKKLIIDEALEPISFYDDWYDYRDGQRINRDRTKLKKLNCFMAKFNDIKKSNQKIKTLIRRRKIRKNIRDYFNLVHLTF